MDPHMLETKLAKTAKVLLEGRQGGEAVWPLLAPFNQTDFPQKPNP